MVYIVFYDNDTGSREDWNVFYTPFEAFTTAAARDTRKATLIAGGYECHCAEVPLTV
jgi:hypothetical protein